MWRSPVRIDSRELLAVGIFGSKSRIGDRIEMLLRRGRTFSPRASATGVVVSTVVLGGFLLAGSLAPRWIAFAQAQPRPSFEVASIKPGDPNSHQFGIGIRGSLFIATNASLKMMIGFAYDVQDHQISGGPKWLDSDRFSIEAKPKAAIPFSMERMEPLKLMLQSLLEERFKLAFHRETRVEPVYELVVAKGGPRLKENSAPGPDGRVGLFGRGRGDLTATAMPIAVLAGTLSQRMGRSVIDKTGLSGKYDFTLVYTPDQSTPGGPDERDAPAAPDPAGPSIFTALQEQLGLKLESAKGPVEILVIDRAEKPDAN
jgi:uncharacterized protein (TIGR03435 family)